MFKAKQLVTWDEQQTMNDLFQLIKTSDDPDPAVGELKRLVHRQKRSKQRQIAFDSTQPQKGVTTEHVVDTLLVSFDDLQPRRTEKELYK